MNVAQLLHKLRVISNVEIVVPLLPEMLGCPIQARLWLGGRVPIKRRDTLCFNDFSASASVSCCGSLSSTGGHSSLPLA